MIVPNYSSAAIERVLPRLALDFTTASLDPRVTVTRTLNTATRVNSNGLIEIVNANLPRFDYSPTSIGTPRGLLIEEQRTNLLTYSDAIDNIAWNPTNVTVGTDVITSPDGALNADKLQDTIANGLHAISRIVTISANTTYTLSFYVKSAEYSQGRIFFGNGSNGFQVNFNLSTVIMSGGVALGTGTYSGATITPVGNSWYRLTMTGIIDASSTSGTLYLYMNNGTSVVYTGVVGNGMYIWGAQLEAGAFVTSYIPTTTTSLTRNNDDVSMTGTNFSDWFTAGAGTLYSEGSQPIIFAASRSCVSLCASANNPRITNYRQSAGGINGYAINSAGAGTAVSSGVTATPDLIQKTALSYSATNLQTVSVNGSNTASITTDMTTSLSALTGLRIGSDFLGDTKMWGGYVRKIMWWPQQLTAAELRAFST